MYCRIVAGRASFEFDLRRRVSVVIGESATGKSFLCEILSTRSQAPKTITCEHRVITVAGSDGEYEVWFKDRAGSLIFVDEKDWQHSSSTFYAYAIEYGCMLVVCCRKLRCLPVDFAINAVFEIKFSGKFGKAVTYFNLSSPSKFTNKFITEDSGFGLQFLKRVLSNISSAYGKDNIPKRVLDGEYECTYIVDGAAFGNCLPEIYPAYEMGRIAIVAPESLEELLLHSTIFESDPEVSCVLKRPEEYGANDSKYSSWEPFFTAYIKHKLTEHANQGYCKESGSRCLIDACCYRGGSCMLHVGSVKNKVSACLVNAGYGWLVNDQDTVSYNGKVYKVADVLESVPETTRSNYVSDYECALEYVKYYVD